MADGALGSISVTSASHVGWEHTLHFEGTEGLIELHGGRARAVRFKDKALTERVEKQLAEAADPKGVAAAKSYYGTGHPALIADVVDAVREGRAPFVTGEQAAHAVRIVLGAYESARRSAWVDVAGAPAVAR